MGVVGWGMVGRSKVGVCVSWVGKGGWVGRLGWGGLEGWWAMGS